MALRPSQVETLRFIREGLMGRTMSECADRFEVHRSGMWKLLFQSSEDKR